MRTYYQAHHIESARRARRERLREDLEFLVLPIATLVVMFVLASVVPGR